MKKTRTILFVLLTALLTTQLHWVAQAEKHEISAASSTDILYRSSSASDLWLVDLSTKYAYAFEEKLQAAVELTYNYNSTDSLSKSFVEILAGPQFNFDGDENTLLNSFYIFGLFGVTSSFATDFTYRLGLGKRIPLFGDNVAWNPSISVRKRTDFTSLYRLRIFSLSVLF